MRTSKLGNYYSGRNWDRFDIGAFEAWTHVLNLLNTCEDKMIDKSKLYSIIMKLRPEVLKH